MEWNGNGNGNGCEYKEFQAYPRTETRNPMLIAMRPRTAARRTTEISNNQKIKNPRSIPAKQHPVATGFFHERRFFTDMTGHILQGLGVGACSVVVVVEFMF